MEVNLLNLPNELLELIAFNIINKPWKNDVHNFYAFTSTCRRLYSLSHDERYWEKMASRRDPTNKKPSETMTWLEYCKQIYLMRTISSDDLQENISRFDENYYCTIEKILLWPDKIRIYIDERGDNSLGNIQSPMFTSVGFIENSHPLPSEFKKILPNDSQFLIEDPCSRYLGYLDFSIKFSKDHIGKLLIFQYGMSGYSVIRLFYIEQIFIDKYDLFSLMSKSENNE